MARQEQPSKRPKILLVDGNAVFRTSFSGFLNRRQFEVATSASGEEALDLLGSHGPSLCIIDLLPGGRMTGVQIAEALHARDPSLRFIFLSAYLQPAWDERPAFLDRAPLFRKPVDLEELTSAVSRALSAAQPPSPRRASEGVGKSETRRRCV